MNIKAKKLDEENDNDIKGNEEISKEEEEKDNEENEAISKKDKESNIEHVKHALCSLAYAIEIEERKS